MRITRTELITETGVLPITIAVLSEDESSSLPPLPEADDDERYGPYLPACLDRWQLQLRPRPGKQ